MLYLYVKTHNITGLKYLGKTKQNPFNYLGSGKIWTRHIKKHGKNISTQILLTTESKEELKETGLFFSRLWNIVESDDWANCRPEEGDGGDNSANIDYAYARKMRNQPHVKAKREKVIEEKYGKTYYSNLHKISAKAIFENFGISNMMKLDHIKQKHKESLPLDHQSGSKNSQFGKKFKFVCNETCIKKIELDNVSDYLKACYQLGKKWKPLEESNLAPSILR